jgi:hypothetical protein
VARQSWEELVGQKICGGYAIRELIGSTDASAVYLTFQGEERVALKLLGADETAAPASHDIPRIDYSGIIQLHTSGECEVDGEKYRYFVMEAADENLATVVASRALSPDEAREMLAPLLDALAYLHERGLAHGSVKPSNIMAKADSVKLSVDSIRPSGAVASPDQDMRDLGLTIVEVLTQRRQVSAIAELPQPFRDIVEHALDPDPGARWTARQAAMRLAGKLEKPAAPVEKAAPAMEVPLSEGEERKKLSPVWLLGALAAAMLLVVIFVMSRGSSSSAASAPQEAPAVAPRPAATAPPVVTPAPRRDSPFEARTAQPQSRTAPPQPKTVPPQSSTTLPQPNGAAPAAAPAPVVKGHGWFVVVASYAREADAALEAHALSRKFPQFKLSVFPPSAIDTHYLVIIGSGLGQDGAEALRQRAVSSGLPGDTYIKKYPDGRR